VPISEQATPADYALLGLQVGAPADEVKKAYRKLALENHPDITGGDERREAMFKRATHAYERIVRAPLSPVITHEYFEQSQQATQVRPPVPYTPPPPQLSTLSRGDQVWIAPDAIHVGLDGHCYIDPVARLHQYETSTSAICVDMDSEGYRISFPSTLRATWSTEDIPIGLEVATVRIVPPVTAARVRAAEYNRMPPQLISTILLRAPEGDVYVPADAIRVGEAVVKIDLDSAFSHTPSHRAPVRVSRRGEQRFVRTEGRLSDWLQRRNKLGENSVAADAAQIGSTTVGARTDPSG
jgi:DnaJ domain